jgi:flagellar biosynthesis anti-sigma factor FlgM
MKINPNVPAPGDAQSGAISNANKAATPASAANVGNTAPAQAGDTFQSSSQHAQVQHLASQLANVPDVRADLVAPLKAAVQQQTYQPDSGKLADALLSTQFGPGGKAA